MTNSLSCLLLGLWLPLSVFTGGVGFAADMGGSATTLSSAIEGSLNITGNADLLAPLAEALASFGRADQALRVDELVAALNSGVKPDQLSEKIRDAIKIDDPGSYQRQQSWKWGNPNSRKLLVKYIWAKGQNTQATQEKKAADYARAALLLAAQDEFWLNSAVVALVTRDRALYVKVAGLNDKSASHLFEVIDRAEQLDASFYRQYLTPWIDEVSAVRDARASESSALLAKMFDDADLSLAGAKGNDGHEYEVLNVLSDLIQALKASSDAAAAGSIEAHLVGYRNSATLSGIANHWLAQYQNRQSPPDR